MPTLYNPANESYTSVAWSSLKVVCNLEPWVSLLAHPSNSSVYAILEEDGYIKPQVVKSTQAELSKAALNMKNNKPLVPLEGFSFGADPELFVKNDEGEIVCADMIPGTKDVPHKVEFGAVQRDGFAAEYNIDPCSTFEEWNRNHKAVQGQLQSMLPKGFTLVALPAHRFSPDVFKAAPDEAKELGCSPDWNAWEASLNPPPKLPDDPTLRCTGGHIHVGWCEDADVHDVQHMMNGFDLVKQMDWFIGAWSVKHDKDVTRRRLYGKAGSCRIKPYGVEYRTLSSFWVMDKALRLEVWNRMVQAVACMQKQCLPETAPSSYNQLVQVSINEGKLSGQLSKGFNFPINTITQLAA